MELSLKIRPIAMDRIRLSKLPDLAQFQSQSSKLHLTCLSGEIRSTLKLSPPMSLAPDQPQSKATARLS